MAKSRATYLMALAAIACQACAISYYDAESGTHHLVGVGYMRMRAEEPGDKLQATAIGTEVAGLEIGFGKDFFHSTAGWNRRSRILIHPGDASMRVEWPSNDPFEIRVGAEPPFGRTVDQEVLSTTGAQP